MTLSELFVRMTAAEFNEWVAFDRLEPIGREHGQWGGAPIARPAPPAEDLNETIKAAFSRFPKAP